ncbi:hypothetical protein HF1_11180 [Mycoplasma haemofelis str. Langford 1]|uniref:Uncharacterized protein n=1 Tax=Mycoplasma haemofelis (strain Langford 1) TaxID=941640 RepID=E8ZJ05_MYCHL|nr:hypothetical protein [Mycoplasma haemofelis]CBY93126.1 hypothetical protein HF1_11180 [Mycoplasma haemofelis str. Langford 1]
MDPKMLGLMGGVGAVGAGGAYLAVTNSSKEGQLISELIRSEAFVKPLTKDSKDNAKWDEAWKRYRDTYKNSGDIWGIPNWEQKKDQENAFDEFKNKCEERSKLKVDSESKEYKDFKNYCARPKTVSELIGEEGKVTLLSKSGNSDGTAWNNAWEVYRKANLKEGKNNEYKDSDTWTIGDWATAKQSNTATENYKTKCETQAGLDIDVSKGLEDTNFINVKNWCTKPIS